MASEAKPLPEPRAFATTGRLEWIGVRKAHRGEVVSLKSARLLAGRGITGDHFTERAGGGRRQVTLIQHEHLPLVARFAGIETIDPGVLRRNLVISGINLCALMNRRFHVGETVLEAVDDCAPCLRMEEAIGRGGFNAMRGHGGLIAIVRVGGRVTIGDAVAAVAEVPVPPGKSPLSSG